MKKMTLLAMILALIIGLTACSDDQATQAADVTTVPTEVTEAVESVPAQPLSLTDWSMSASTWSSPNGATIHICATPNYYAEGQNAQFVVRLENDEVCVAPCQWDGTSYTASADLNAANGYCYYMILTAADGASTEVAVNTPAEPTNEAFINIEAALEAYCNVIIEESAVEKNQLTLSVGNVQVKTPLITNDGEAITCQEAVLVLSFNGEELEQKVLTLTQTEVEGQWEAQLDQIAFAIPELESEQQVDLMLNVTLTNGQVLSAYAGNWRSSEDGLLPVVG